SLRPRRPPLALRLDDVPCRRGRRRARQVVGPGPNAFAHLSQPALAHRVAQRAPLGGAARTALDDREAPITVPPPQAGREAPVLHLSPPADTAREFVHPVDRAQLSPLDHPAQRDPGGALGYAEEIAPLD